MLATPLVVEPPELFDIRTSLHFQTLYPSHYSDEVRTPNLNPLTATATDVQELLSSGRVTSEQLVYIYGAQMETFDEHLYAMISRTPKSIVRRTARRLDAERRQGKIRSPVHGIPFVIKDNMNTAEEFKMDTTAGSLAFVGSVAERSSYVVEKMVEAGGILLGKTNQTELNVWTSTFRPGGYSATGGQTRSAYVRKGDPTLHSPLGHGNPGSSSSGAAVALSAGFAPISIGSETAGSLVYPANRAALYTIKPTVGIVPTDGMIPLCRYCDAAGPMANCTLDIANILDIIVEPSMTQPPQSGYASAITGSWSELRIGALGLRTWQSDQKLIATGLADHEDMISKFQEAYETIAPLAQSFHSNVQMNPLPESTWDIWHATYSADLKTYLSTLKHSPIHSLEDLAEFYRQQPSANHPPPLNQPGEPTFLEQALASTTSTADIEAEISRIRRLGRDKGIDQILSDFDIDAIIGPAESELLYYAAAAGYPVASVPLGYLRSNGRPFGMAITTTGHMEDVLIRVMSAWEATFPARVPPDMGKFRGRESWAKM